MNKTDEERVEEFIKRVEANDAVAMCELGTSRGRFQSIALIGREFFGRLSDFNVDVGN